MILHERHWFLEDYRQRITKKQWQQIMLKNQDTINFRGQVYQLKVTDLGYGVLEVYKDLGKM